MPFDFKAHPLTVEDNGAEHFCRTNRRYAICGYVTDRHRIAWIEGAGSDPRKIADLFAAAPDLLAACEECLKVVDECYQATAHFKVANTSEQRLKIEAAIAKARGAQV